MGEYQRLPNGDDLCQDHIKLYDRYFEHWSDDLPSRALSNRVTKHTHIKHIYGQSLPRTILFCMHRSSAVYRPTIGRQSSVFLGRATIGRRSDGRSLILVIRSVSDVLRAQSRFVKFVGGEAAGRTPYTFYKPTLGPKYVSNRPYNEFITPKTLI